MMIEHQFLTSPNKRATPCTRYITQHYYDQLNGGTVVFTSMDGAMPYHNKYMVAYFRVKRKSINNNKNENNGN